VLLLCVLLLGSGPAAAEGVELSVLSYNTHGLPSLLVRDAPTRRFPEIARQIGRYDVALLQEDFAHHELLQQHLDATAGVRVVATGNPSRSSWCPICSGSGLTLVSRLPESAWSRIDAQPYGLCSGWLGGASDCFATKGFLRARLALEGGLQIDFVETHLDASDGEGDRVVRHHQLEALRRALGERAGDAALIVVGDFNLDAGDARDVRERRAFTSALGLANSGAAASAGSSWERLDYIFYRSGQRTQLAVIEASEDEGFTLKGKPLSDHPAIQARFRASPTPR